MKGTDMGINEWTDSLTDEQRAALATMDDEKIMDYLAAEGVELPDEALEGIAGGVPLGKLVAGWLKERLGLGNK